MIEILVLLGLLAITWGAFMLAVLVEIRGYVKDCRGAVKEEEEDDKDKSSGSESEEEEEKRDDKDENIGSESAEEEVQEDRDAKEVQEESDDDGGNVTVLNNLLGTTTAISRVEEGAKDE